MDRETAGLLEKLSRTIVASLDAGNIAETVDALEKLGHHVLVSLDVALGNEGVTKPKGATAA
jgi:hypothetical protein